MAGTKRSREGEPLINIKPDSNSNTVTTNSNNPVEQKEENASTTTTTTMAVAADVAMTDTDTADTTMAEMAEPSSSDSQQRQIQLIFETFRDELDEHYDRRERIVKATRDITALSKKMYVFVSSYLEGQVSVWIVWMVLTEHVCAEYSPCSG